MRSLFLLLAVSTAVTQAGTISTTAQDNGTTVNAIDITGFTTTGDLMAGLVITGTFTGGVTADCIWATTGAASGGCTGTNGNAAFSMSLDGDSFSSDWFLNVGGTLNLTSLFFNGIPGNTVFDRTLSPGTDGSSTGFDAAGTTVPAGIDGVATYIDQVATLGNPPQGDIFARVRINFSGDGLAPLAGAPSANWIMDTDNIGIRNGDPGSDTPEPSTWAMMLTGGALVAFGSRRRLSAK